MIAFDRHPTSSLHLPRLLVLGWVSLLINACSVQPSPLPAQAIADRALHDQEQLQIEAPRPGQPVTLEHALKMALNHNLEQRVKMVEAALAHGRLNLALQQLLPVIGGSLTRHERTRDAASFSDPIEGGTTASGFSTSLEKIYTSGDATLVWNLLDFGVSYIHAHQQADDLLIAAQRQRKVALDIVRDVRFAFWQALSAEALLPEVESGLQTARLALEKSRRLERERLRSSDETMDDQEELLRQIQFMVELQKQLLQAKTRLASLMNIRPGTPWLLDLSVRDHLEVPEVGFSTGQLEELAMVSRPELLEEDYRQRISAMETRVALLKILPGLETTLAGRADDNRYLRHSGWGEVAWELSYSLNDLFAAPERFQTARIGEQLAMARRLAMAMTILTQVNLAVQDFQQAKSDFALADELYALKKRQTLRESAAKSVRGGASLALERRQVEGLVAAIQRDRSYAELQNAYGMILHSVGLEQLPPPEVVHGGDLRALARFVHEERHPDRPLEWTPPATGTDRFDAIMPWFGRSAPPPRPLSPRRWPLVGDQDTNPNIPAPSAADASGKTVRGFASPAASNSSEGTKKWILVDQ
ncbi:MAG: TolC family protein [Magnetococcales bacterium]|nr:TolC family protein [Magnetococcales bacterium]